MGARQSGHFSKYVIKQTNVRDIQIFKQNIYEQIKNYANKVMMMKRSRHEWALGNQGIAANM